MRSGASFQFFHFVAFLLLSFLPRDWPGGGRGSCHRLPADWPRSGRTVDGNGLYIYRHDLTRSHAINGIIIASAGGVGPPSSRSHHSRVGMIRVLDAQLAPSVPSSSPSSLSVRTSNSTSTSNAVSAWHRSFSTAGRRSFKCEP